MMAAYQTQPGMMPPGMPQPGHPAMTPGQPISQAQMQQMAHAGVSGPGIPHSQAGAMMQPGVNGMPGMGGQMAGMPGQMGGQSMSGGMPNAQAFSQLNPLMQQQIIQQQQQQMGLNPNEQAQRQMMAQRMMAQRQLQQQQQQQNAMQGMSPQQIQQMQNSGQSMHPQSVQLNPNLTHQMLLQQQRLQAAQVAQHQNQQAQHNQQQLQQQLAMQHANSQSSNPGSQQGGPAQQVSQPQQPQQMRPQSRTANPNDQNHGQPPPTPQSGGPAQPQQPGQQTPQQGQPAAMPQQGQQQPMNPQQMAMLQQQRQRAMAAQQAQQQQQAQMGQPQQGMTQQQQMALQQRMAHAAQAQQQSQGWSGAFVLRCLLVCNEISGLNAAQGKNPQTWHQVVNKHFSPEARVVHEMQIPSAQTDPSGGAQTDTKSWEVIRPIIPKYFQTFYDSNAIAFRIYPEGPSEKMDNGQVLVNFLRCTYHVDYDNGSRLEMSGSLSFLSGTGQNANLIETMDIKTEAGVEVVMRRTVEDLVTNWSPTMDNKTSPKMTKKPPKAQQKPQSALEGLTINHFPKTPRGKNGPLPRLQAFLEVGETMNVMNELICFADDHKMRPGPAMEALVAQFEREQQQQQQQHQMNPQINFPPNGILPAGNRTPSMGTMPMPGQQFSSPAMSNLNAPMMNGSPHIPNHPGLAPNMNMPNSHTPSPHQSNMAAPQMMPQHSQQGTNSSAASANTSPNVNNKRRRSTVKMEGDEGGGEGGPAAARVKPSPRMGNKKGKGA